MSMLQESFLNHWLEIAVKILREAHEGIRPPGFMCIAYSNCLATKS